MGFGFCLACYSLPKCFLACPIARYGQYYTCARYFGPYRTKSRRAISSNLASRPASIRHGIRADHTRPAAMIYGRSKPKGFSPLPLLTEFTGTTAAKHMLKSLLMQLCIEQQESGDREASVRATAAARRQRPEHRSPRCNEDLPCAPELPAGRASVAGRC